MNAESNLWATSNFCYLDESTDSSMKLIIADKGEIITNSSLEIQIDWISKKTATLELTILDRPKINKDAYRFTDFNDDCVKNVTKILKDLLGEKNITVNEKIDKRVIKKKKVEGISFNSLSM